MNPPAFVMQVALFFLAATSSFGQSTDSLTYQLQEADSDTARITLLIDHVNTLDIDQSEEATALLKQAYELSQRVTSLKHKSRSAIAYGSYLAEVDLDSGMLLISNGIQGYRESGLELYVANGLLIKGQTYEIENRLDSAEVAYKQGFEIASKNQFHPEWGDAAFSISIVNNLRGNNVQALEWALEAKNAYELAGNDNALMSDVHNQIGIIYDQQRLYPQALENYLQAKDYAVSGKYFEGILQTDNNIGVIYDNMNIPETALEYFTDALEKARINSLEYDEATLLNNISFVHQKRGDTATAISLLKASLAINVSSYDECFRSYPLEALGSLYAFTGKLDSAELLLSQALEIATLCEEVAIISSIYKSLGQLYQRKQEIRQSRSALERSLQIAEDADLPTELSEALYGLYALHDQIGQNGQALEYLKRYSSLTDSLSKANTTEKATQLASEYEFRKEVARLESERIESELALADEISSKSRTNKIALIVSILLLGIAVIFVRGNMMIRKSNKRLSEINAEKNKLIGVVAHDLRNPLNMIQGLLPLLEEVQDDISHPYYAQYLDMMNQSTDKMKVMIDRTLDVSAIENMKLNLQLQKSNLNQLVLRSIENFKLIAEKKKITLVNNIERQADFTSIVDPNYLEQVLDNLISNAIKFSEAGKEIFIGLVNVNNKNLIEVRDHGPGIPEEDQKKIYQAFSTTSVKPTAHESSTGLGLSIAYKFVQAMQGEIKVNSKTGEGTSFIVSFKEA